MHLTSLSYNYSYHEYHLVSGSGDKKGKMLESLFEKVKVEYEVNDTTKFPLSAPTLLVIINELIALTEKFDDNLVGETERTEPTYLSKCIYPKNSVMEFRTPSNLLAALKLTASVIKTTQADSLFHDDLRDFMYNLNCFKDSLKAPLKKYLLPFQQQEKLKKVNHTEKNTPHHHRQNKVLVLMKKEIFSMTKSIFLIMMMNFKVILDQTKQTKH